ncbi:MAG: hypothetical protein P4L31_07790 [Candidatus Babeliales bacterium]|nr:hypothetical protein [Candidatus Babeliales bacterium]
MKNIYFVIALLNVGYFVEVKPSVEADQHLPDPTISVGQAFAFSYAEVKGIEIVEPIQQKALKEKEAVMERDKLNAGCWLDKCCRDNVDAPRTEQGVPLPCQKAAAMLAMYAGAKVADKQISDFNKHAPASTQTRQEYEAKEKANQKKEPKTRGWFW